jgi:hypothetical protein
VLTINDSPVDSIYFVGPKVVKNKTETNDLPVIIVKETVKESHDLTASITEITSLGKLTLTFNVAVAVPEEYYNFNSSVIDVLIEPGITSSKDDLLFNYTLTSFTTS